MMKFRRVSGRRIKLTAYQLQTAVRADQTALRSRVLARGIADELRTATENPEEFQYLKDLINGELTDAVADEAAASQIHVESLVRKGKKNK